MTIKQDTVYGWIISRYYKWIFGDLAQDICTLFWTTLASIFLLPFTIPAYFASFVFGRYDVWENRNLLGKAFRGLLVYFCTFLGLAFGIATFEKVFGPAWKTWDFWPVMGAALLGFIGIAVTIVLGILAIVGVCAGINWIYVTIRNSFRKKVVRQVIDEDGHEYDHTYYEPKEMKIVTLWNAIRSKYCTKIEWK